MPHSKHVPQRTCVICRRTAPKRELVRLVRGADGEIVVDRTGKLPGRGAYVCRSEECARSGVSKKAIERALKARTSPEALDRLRALLSAGLPPSDAHSDDGGSRPRGGVA